MKDDNLQELRPDGLTAVEVLKKAIQISVTRAGAPFIQTFMQAFLAGMFVSLGAMFMLFTKADDQLSFAVSGLLGAFAFLLGLFMIVTTGAELFTGNCLMICGSADKKITWKRLFRNWAIVYLGNLVGALLMVTILFFANFWMMNDGALGNAMISVAANKIAQPWYALLLKGVMCNLLVCLAVWLSYASRTIVDKFFAILLPIMAFVACGFEHCIANMFFLPMGLVMKLSGFTYLGTADISQLTLGGILYNIPIVTIGNIIGGAVLVGLVYWFTYRKSLRG